MDYEQWVAFYQAGGRPTLAEWLRLTEAQRADATRAGTECIEIILGELGKATKNLKYALKLCRDTEALDEMTTQETFAAFRANHN